MHLYTHVTFLTLALEEGSYFLPVFFEEACFIYPSEQKFEGEYIGNHTVGWMAGWSVSKFVE